MWWSITSELNMWKRRGQIKPSQPAFPSLLAGCCMHLPLWTSQANHGPPRVNPRLVSTLRRSAFSPIIYHQWQWDLSNQDWLESLLYRKQHGEIQIQVFFVRVCVCGVLGVLACCFIGLLFFFFVHARSDMHATSCDLIKSSSGGRWGPVESVSLCLLALSWEPRERGRGG